MKKVLVGNETESDWESTGRDSKYLTSILVAIEENDQIQNVLFKNDIHEQFVFYILWKISKFILLKYFCNYILIKLEYKYSKYNGVCTILTWLNQTPSLP